MFAAPDGNPQDVEAVRLEQSRTAMMDWHQGAVRLRYALDGASGPAVVLIHELGGSLDSYDGVAERLQQDFRVLRYDLRGAGESETPPQPFTVDDWVEDLRALLRATKLPRPWHLVGGAIGALIAVAFALRYPRDVATLTLLAPALGANPSRRGEIIARTKIALEKGMAEITDTSLGRSYPEAVRHDAGRFERFRQTMLRANPQGYVYCNLVRAYTNLEARLSELGLPAQFVAGTHDPIRTPSIVQGLAARVTGSHYEEIDSGHFMHVQTPLLVADRIAAWVKSHAKV